MQESFHGLIGPFGYLGFWPYRCAWVVFVWSEAGKAAELPRILEAGEAIGDGNHVDGDALPDAVDTGQELFLPRQNRVRGNDGIYLCVYGLDLRIDSLYDFIPSWVFVLKVARGHVLLLVG